MIKTNTPVFLTVSEERQTPNKVQNLVVNFQSALVQEQVDGQLVNQGKIGSWVYDEQGTNIMGVQKIQNIEHFDGKDILATLTEEYIAELQVLNPTVTFTDTLKL